MLRVTRNGVTRVAITTDAFFVLLFSFFFCAKTGRWEDGVWGVWVAYDNPKAVISVGTWVTALGGLFLC